jgi:hypothetical protein
MASALLLAHETFWHSFWRWPGWIAVTALGTLLLFVGVFAAIWAIRQDRKASQMEAVIDLIREHRSPEMRKARKMLYDLVRQADPEQIPPVDPALGINVLSPEHQEALEQVSHFLDGVALLVQRKLLQIRHAETYFGLSIISMWDAIGPYIYAERQRAEISGDYRRVTYQRHFEDLAAKMNAKERRIICKLNRLKNAPPAGQNFERARIPG